jgi:flavin reductase (DIM6/NTAB) family NADH-FMN oxidoreductase RutF
MRVQTIAENAMTPVTVESFKAAMGRFTAGVTVVTTHTDEIDHGMTASAFCSLSLDPPLVLVCIKSKNQTYDLVTSAGSFVVNILSRQQEAISNRFAGGYMDDAGQWQSWPADRDKFADIGTSRSESTGALILDGCLANVECTLETVHDGGDHGIFVGRIQSIRLASAEALDPLAYFSGRYRSVQ